VISAPIFMNFGTDFTSNLFEVSVKVQVQHHRTKNIPIDRLWFKISSPKFGWGKLLTADLSTGKSQVRSMSITEARPRPLFPACSKTLRYTKLN